MNKTVSMRLVSLPAPTGPAHGLPCLVSLLKEGYVQGGYCLYFLRLPRDLGIGSLGSTQPAESLHSPLNPGVPSLIPK